jgi:hypothetical protein
LQGQGGVGGGEAAREKGNAMGRGRVVRDKRSCKKGEGLSETGELVKETVVTSWRER